MVAVVAVMVAVVAVSVTVAPMKTLLHAKLLQTDGNSSSGSNKGKWHKAPLEEEQALKVGL